MTEKWYVVYINGVNMGIVEADDMCEALTLAMSDVEDGTTEVIVRETEQYFPE